MFMILTLWTVDSSTHSSYTSMPSYLISDSNPYRFLSIARSMLNEIRIPISILMDTVLTSFILWEAGGPELSSANMIPITCSSWTEEMLSRCYSCRLIQVLSSKTTDLNQFWWLLDYELLEFPSLLEKVKDSIALGSSYEIPVVAIIASAISACTTAATGTFVFIWLSSKEPKYVRAQ